MTIKLKFNDPNIIALAAAVIGVRKKAAIADIQTALEDAYWILHPATTKADYKAWETRNGFTPTTEAEDKAAAELRQKNMASVVAKISRGR